MDDMNTDVMVLRVNIGGNSSSETREEFCVS